MENNVINEYLWQAELCNGVVLKCNNLSLLKRMARQELLQIQSNLYFESFGTGVLCRIYSIRFGLCVAILRNVNNPWKNYQTASVKRVIRIERERSKELAEAAHANE